jgi:hypothetical protein
MNCNIVTSLRRSGEDANSGSDEKEEISDRAKERY